MELTRRTRQQSQQSIRIKELKTIYFESKKSILDLMNLEGENSKIVLSKKISRFSVTLKMMLIKRIMLLNER